jgi:hypothetical protein
VDAFICGQRFWPYLVSAVILLFVLDVALRRIDFSLWWPMKLGR